MFVQKINFILRKHLCAQVEEHLLHLVVSFITPAVIILKENLKTANDKLLQKIRSIPVFITRSNCFGYIFLYSVF